MSTMRCLVRAQGVRVVSIHGAYNQRHVLDRVIESSSIETAELVKPNVRASELEV